MGSFRLDLPNERVRLSAFGTQGQRPCGLFVRFRAATSRKETDGAGRSIEARPGDDGRYVVDLNKGYDPYCADSEGRAWPLPPRENRLKVPMRVGARYEAQPAGAAGRAGSTTRQITANDKGAGKRLRHPGVRLQRIK